MIIFLTKVKNLIFIFYLFVFPLRSRGIAIWGNNINSDD